MPSPRLLRLTCASVAASATLLGLGVAAPSTAQAEASGISGSTSAADFVLYNQCQQHDLDYALQVDGTSFWRVDVQVFDPAELTSEGDVVSSTKGSPTTGAVQMQFCGSELPGAWTVRGVGTYQFFPGVSLTIPIDDSHFTVSAAQTATVLIPKRERHGRRTVVTKVQEQVPGGMAPADGVDVHLERLVGGAWQPIRRSATTTVHGRATTRLARGTRGTLRAVTTGARQYDGSVSGSVSIHR